MAVLAYIGDDFIAFGNSFSSDNRPVIDKIKERIPVTLLINFLSLIIIIMIAIPLGVASATYQGSLFDKAVTVFVFVGFATPAFWLALLLMILFGVHLGWLPISGLTSLNYEQLSLWGMAKDRISHLLLPVFVSAFGGLAGFSRYMRSNMLEVIRQDYITTARAKGLSETTVIFKHALRNSLIPLATGFGHFISIILAGSFLIEKVFNIDGMGLLGYTSIVDRDYPVVLGILVISSLLGLIGNILSDICYVLIDPRIEFR